VSATDSPYRPRPVESRAAAAADLELVADILARAFYTDPAWSWAFPDDARRLEQHRAYWGLLAAAAIPYGSVRIAAGGTAVAVWIPPEKPELRPEDEERLVPLIEDMLGDGADRVFDVFECFEEAHPHDRGPHHYLSLLGTDTEQAGQGFGMGLLAANLVEIDRSGGAAYLESTNPTNNRRYERLGFSVCGEFALPEDGPDVTQMWRDPR
jgi:GNAT superfamily N-acetyltransferase